MGTQHRHVFRCGTLDREPSENGTVLIFGHFSLLLTALLPALCIA
jgi:hypothetical protein